VQQQVQGRAQQVLCSSTRSQQHCLQQQPCS
jgi:hypothetical protein